MTEQEWLACADPEPMLKHLRPTTTERKLRLFGLVCASRISELIVDPRSEAAIEFAETHVETGMARRKGRPKIEREAHDAWNEAYHRMSSASVPDKPHLLSLSCAADVALMTVRTDAHFDAGFAAGFASWAVAWREMLKAGLNTYPELPHEFTKPENQVQANLLRCIFRNPVRTIAFDPKWLTPTVSRMAEALYLNKQFTDLPILGDALEDAGCTSQEILTHCREKTKHVRGCWVVDLILGKE